jgi:hypothetical protein
MDIAHWLRKKQASMRPLWADATFAVFLGVFTALIIESLSLAGIVTVKGAAIALVFAWFIGVGSTFFLDHIWPITGRHRIVFSGLLGVVLLTVGFVEYEAQPIPAAAATSVMQTATFNAREIDAPPLSPQDVYAAWRPLLRVGSEAQPSIAAPTPRPPECENRPGPCIYNNTVSGAETGIRVDPRTNPYVGGNHISDTTTAISADDLPPTNLRLPPPPTPAPPLRPTKK